MNIDEEWAWIAGATTAGEHDWEPLNDQDDEPAPWMCRKCGAVAPFAGADPEDGRLCFVGEATWKERTC
jgi:hypothetical protein